MWLRCGSSNPLASAEGIEILFNFIIKLIFLTGLSYLTHQESPSINYKYVEKKILPIPTWWKRGTHHFYDNSDVKVVEA